MRTELCSFSGYKVYPGHGKIYVRLDSKSFRFLNGKTESYSLQRLNPRKFNWTVVFRRMRKKGITEEQAKKRTRRSTKIQRGFTGMTLEALRQKRTQKPEVRQAARDKVIQEAKAKRKAEQEKKKAEKVKTQATSGGIAMKTPKNVKALNKAPKGAKGGAGGKR